MIIYMMEQEQFENNSEAQIVQKLKNNEPRPRFTGSYKKKRRVPQGSLLTTLLFLLFIDDIETNIDSQIRLFADDCLVH